MRRWIIAVLFLAPAAAMASPVIVLEPTVLLAKAGARTSAITSIHAGAIVDLLRFGQRWSLIVLGGHKGYVASGALASVDPPAVYYDQSADRTCGYGYPYSGSGLNFTGLAELRTSEPLGALFGYHRRWPC